jgi:ABC-type Mn2+/Zn2+ transport system permease subunit
MPVPKHCFLLACRFVKAMLLLPPEEANCQTKSLMQQLHFASTYAFGKYLTELMFSGSLVIPPGVTRAIVRPSLIASIAESPYPG